MLLSKRDYWNEKISGGLQRRAAKGCPGDSASARDTGRHNEATTGDDKVGGELEESSGRSKDSSSTSAGETNYFTQICIQISSDQVHSPISSINYYYYFFFFIQRRRYFFAGSECALALGQLDA